MNECDYNWEQIETGSEKYDFIMKLFNNTDVSKDESFQKKFTGFYRIRRNRELFLNEYYEYMEYLKGKSVDFKTILITIRTFINTIEPSFSSKLFATLKPNMPVWDKYVLINLGLATSITVNKTIDDCVKTYYKICNWYSDFLKTNEAKEMIQMFDTKLPKYAHFTSTKKIDLMLWQKR